MSFTKTEVFHNTGSSTIQSTAMGACTTLTICATKALLPTISRSYVNADHFHREDNSRESHTSFSGKTGLLFAFAKTDTSC